MKHKYDIFISYRRSGGFESANLIAEKLRGMGYSVFFDVESLRSGRFNEQLYQVIEQCKDFVLVLPENALDRCSNSDGKANPADWIRKETLHAMEHHKNIIPVMLTGFTWPNPMPLEMETLCDYQAITATSYETFDLAMLRLAGYLKSQRHRFKLLKVTVCIFTSLVILVAIAYFALLQIAKPICTSVANEYSIAMQLVHELRNDEENIKIEWNKFINSYRTASTETRKSNLESDMVSYLQHCEEKSENLRSQIRPVLELSDWQIVLLGLYDSQKEDVQALPTFVSSYVDELENIISKLQSTAKERTFKPYETQIIDINFQFYERTVDMLFYAYLKDITKLPKNCLKSHESLSRSWNLFPTSSLNGTQEEYERLRGIEESKIDHLLHNLDIENRKQDNDTYDMEQRLDSLEAMAESFKVKNKQETEDRTNLAQAEERLSLKREIVDLKKEELSEETRRLQQLYEDFKEDSKLMSTDSQNRQWGKIIRMAGMLSKTVANKKSAQQQHVENGAVIKPAKVYNDLTAMLNDYLTFHPDSKSYIAPLYHYYKRVADGKQALGGQLVFAFKDNLKHPLYRVGDIIIKRNGILITNNNSLATAVNKDKNGTVEFLRLEGGDLILHHETVTESSVLVGYMEIGLY